MSENTLQDVYEAIMAIHRLHVPDEDGDCAADGDPYPCPTGRILMELGEK